jgi:ABC-type dipeptide/oligopeptide/nickel transport system permease component
VIIYSTLLIAMGLVVDLLYGWLDPRIRFDA